MMLTTMTGDDLQEARKTLGQLWGLGRPLQAKELGMVLGSTDRDPGRMVSRYEPGQAIPGPIALAITLMLDGARPKNLQELLGRESGGGG